MKHPTARCRRTCLLLLAFALVPLSSMARPAVPPPGDWRSHGGDLASTRHAPLDRIHRDNVRQLRVAWRWRSPDEEILKARGLDTFANEGTPLLVDGVLYVSTSLSQVAAIDAATGKTIWVFDPESYRSGRPTNLGFLHRGVACWTDGSETRILYATGDAHLIALDAKSGRPIPTFGEGGRVDLTKGLRRAVDRRLYTVNSPPVVCRDVIVVGSSILDYPAVAAMPPGDVRGFDVRTGRPLWTFHAVPQAGETGNETWENDSWKECGNTNVWTMMSADEALGTVYLPFSTPTNDYYGGHRPGHNLFGESLVCLEAKTGKRLWHQQLVHHGIWDYDLPAAPNLCDLTVNGRRVRAVAQVTKQGFCFVFDRVTGAPVWPIEERPVPPSAVPGEKAAPTQPYPTRPAPFDRQGATRGGLIDFTPELRREAAAILDRYDHGPLFTPPTEKGTVCLPSVVGGAGWAGAALDPETGWLYVPSVTFPFVIRLRPGPGPHARFAGSFEVIDGPRGLPLFKPPYGRITAIDLNRGEHVWMTPLGNGPRDHPALKGLRLPQLGWPRRGHVLATKTLLFVGQEGTGTRRAVDPTSPAAAGGPGLATAEPMFRALDKRTGALLHELELPANVSGALMTGMVAGKQLVVVPVGGGGRPAELIAIGLP